MARTVPQQTVAPQPPAAAMLAALERAREDTFALVAHLDDAQLERAYSPIMSPLVWDLAHIAAYEDLWLAHRHAGLELLRPELAERYDAFETPRAVRGEIELLDAPAARAYMAAVRDRVVAAGTRQGIGDGALHGLVLRHELQHTETMRQAMAIADLLPPGEPRLRPLPEEDRWLEIPAGAFLMGAPAEGFSYDNERPRHLAQTPAFRIARRPVTNASWLRFSEGGGYERREWWSAEGWAWKEEYDITHHPSVTAGGAGGSDSPVCHVSWFEADAFARAHGARLPTEAEWERAATWEQAAREADGSHATGGSRHRGGREHPARKGPASGGPASGGPASGGPASGGPASGGPARRGPASERPVQGGPDDGHPALEGVGQVWEWTASTFHGYPGFVAHPYREYSEVFFGEDYRVLRGGSWATSPLIATPTFRNWDLPQRRQIFAGVRLAKDKED
jgi:iron(II)-dependent oxidoreductase